MARQARLDAPGTLRHVMIRGIEGTPIFRDDQDRANFISRISHLVEKTGTKILAWCLMDNHLLVFSGQQGISKFMRCLLTGQAIWYNRKYHRSGHLFQNRHKSIVCEKDPYLLASSIHSSESTQSISRRGCARPRPVSMVGT
jgi:REP element-mobilizing transposase RayT